jgi:hypothetical protein
MFYFGFNSFNRPIICFFIQELQLNNSLFKTLYLVLYYLMLNELNFYVILIDANANSVNINQILISF